MKPCVKYAGGKSHLTPLIKTIWMASSCSRIVEPFAGSAAVTLALEPREALLNDNNEHIINFHQQLQRWLVIEQEFKNEETYYYETRERFNENIRNGKHNTKESAELFLYLNRTCYNGLSRYNKKGEFNVPIGSYKKINYLKDFAGYSILMQDWDIQCGDFENLDIADSDFLFVDPPYDDGFTQYGKEGFSWDDQLRLADWLESHNGPLVVCNKATDRVLSLYVEDGYDVYTYEARRRISCKSERKPVLEMLAFKNIDAATALSGHQQKLNLTPYLSKKAD